MENFTTVDQLSMNPEVAPMATNYSVTMPSYSPVTLSNNSTWAVNTSNRSTDFDLSITTMDTNATTAYNSSTWEYDQSTFTENIGTTWYSTDEKFLSTEQVGTLIFVAIYSGGSRISQTSQSQRGRRRQPIIWPNLPKIA